ncbi:hypothetical protein HPB51_018256 [Rhipicephalus microplus]|uniref:Protein kinase domain-containing protein n=1 Tax=Rhipicephalus microplus TaxID=6941 RepID=A0A9J6D644_RHIMP|nr:hypothetical protein HPB51_018256 [Rhipicephalus microplus]
MVYFNEPHSSFPSYPDDAARYPNSAFYQSCFLTLDRPVTQLSRAADVLQRGSARVGKGQVRDGAPLRAPRVRPGLRGQYIRKRRRASDVRHEIVHEALVLKMAEPCARVVDVREVFETHSELILILELAAGGELQHVLDSEECLPEKDVVRLMRQILEAVQFLHERNIAHLDIKPQNLLLTSSFPQGDILLCDFGISRVIGKGTEIREIVGTPDYVAPEILQYEPISLATDICPHLEQFCRHGPLCRSLLKHILAEQLFNLRKLTLLWSTETFA